MTAEVPIMMTGQGPVPVAHLLTSVMMGGICGTMRFLTVKIWIGPGTVGEERVVSRCIFKMIQPGTYVAGKTAGMTELLRIHSLWRRGHGNLPHRGGQLIETKATIQKIEPKVRIKIITIHCTRINNNLKGSEITVISNSVETGGMMTQT